MIIITISGSAQHGKDTTAGILKTSLEEEGKKVLIIHYADYLKYVAKEYYNWNGKKDNDGRTLLQQLGTNIARVRNPNMWVNVVLEFIKTFGQDFDYILIPDTRFPNEINSLLGYNYDVVTLKINRIGFNNGLSLEQKNHPSETSLNNYAFEYLINSEEGLDKLKNEVIKFKTYLLKL